MKKGNKRILFYIILVVIILIIIVPYFSKEKTETQPPTNEKEIKKIISTSKCDRLEEGEDKWQCYKALAEEERAIEVCEKISKPIFKEDCYYVIAIVTNNISTCNQITDEIIKNICVKDFDEWKNEDCSTLEGYDVLESNCLKYVGIMNDDLTICQRIKVQSYRDSCIKHVTLNLQNK